MTLRKCAFVGVALCVTFVNHLVILTVMDRMWDAGASYWLTWPMVGVCALNGYLSVSVVGALFVKLGILNVRN